MASVGVGFIGKWLWCFCGLVRQPLRKKLCCVVLRIPPRTARSRDFLEITIACLVFATFIQSLPHGVGWGVVHPRLGDGVNVRIYKLKHCRGFQAKNAMKLPSMLEFCVLMQGDGSQGRKNLRNWWHLAAAVCVIISTRI